ncbi:probable disease resistance RPP8-like protein 2 [Brassica rapa]|uniref:probable disease resistance RPP8-like protein 2 n=1 Tax=Brassica campestris TaxID=3711 RepID=UPI00142E3FDA|nr:probable disease resistance RPP8-like protein 2 [Brassica rapa]XP_033147308.1 probable disease resistance RPP8-like protein 2 [Brassica rapa]
MAEGIVSFGVQRLWELLARESERLQGVHEKVDDLKCQMRMLQSLLKDADARKHENEVVRNFLEDVKDIVFDAEDIIESFLLKESSGDEKGIKRRVKRLSCFLVDRRDISMDIEGITKRMSKVIAQMQSFGIQHNVYRSPSLQERQREIRQTYPKRSQKDLVGVEQSVNELVGHLVENDSIQVVSISGMGGIGKTTLARQVFHHDIVRSHFDGFAWICVSQDFKRKDIWQKLLQDLRPHDTGIEQMNEGTLQAKIFHLLETSKYLIVMDDVWKNKDWDIIKDVFPQERGWKMILTSRDEGVGFHANPTCFPFRPKTLTHEESWKLCESIAFPRKEITEFIVDEELEAMGKKMVTHCGGLPLAVKVLGGLLANKNMVEEWKRVDENIQTQIVRIDDKSQDSVYRVLSMSYEDLPMQLKHCFLYLAHFPEDYKIQVKRLYYYWEAEGIITSSGDGETTRKIGEDYIDELVRRNMVIGVKEELSCSWEYCQMHDMMREVCLYKAKEENFLQFIKVPTTSTSTINAHTPTGSRRLAVHGGGNAFDMLGSKNNQKARSVLGFGLDSNLWKQSAQGLRNLQLLRVLDLSLDYKNDSKGGRIPSSIGKLIHLRYLSLAIGWATHVPSSLRNLKLLIYLKLKSYGSVHLPSIFNEMVELRFLLLPFLVDDKTKLELGNLVNLEYLSGFRSENGSITDLLRMKKLRILHIKLKGRYTSETLASSLCELRNLEELSLIDEKLSLIDEKLRLIEENNESDGAYDVDFVWNFIHLRRLALGIHVTRLPDHSRFPPNLAHIFLSDCKMEEDPLQILQKLLHLKSVVLHLRSFVGRKMVCSKGGFPQLCKLEIWNLYDLEEWIVEEGSMPCLRTLSLWNCKKLKELPEGLKYITSLKELEITHENKEWKTKLVPGGGSYHKVQHIPSVQLHYRGNE